MSAASRAHAVARAQALARPRSVSDSLDAAADNLHPVLSEHAPQRPQPTPGERTPLRASSTVTLFDVSPQSLNVGSLADSPQGAVAPGAPAAAGDGAAVDTSIPPVTPETVNVPAGALALGPDYFLRGGQLELYRRTVAHWCTCRTHYPASEQHSHLVDDGLWCSVRGCPASGYPIPQRDCIQDFLSMCNMPTTRAYLAEWEIRDPVASLAAVLERYSGLTLEIVAPTLQSVRPDTFRLTPDVLTIIITRLLHDGGKTAKSHAGMPFYIMSTEAACLAPLRFVYATNATYTNPDKKKMKTAICAAFRDVWSMFVKEAEYLAIRTARRKGCYLRLRLWLETNGLLEEFCADEKYCDRVQLAGNAPAWVINRSLQRSDGRGPLYGPELSDVDCQLIHLQAHRCIHRASRPRDDPAAEPTPNARLDRAADALLEARDSNRTAQERAAAAARPTAAGAVQAEAARLREAAAAAAA